MPGLVNELQQAAMNKAIAVSELLRMAKVISAKLQLPEATVWIDLELKGYTDPTIVPQYRLVRMHVRQLNPYHGWQEINIQSGELRDAICNQQVFDSVPVIESPVERIDKEGGTIGRSLSIPVEQFIRKQLPIQLQLQAQTDASAFHAILDGTRTRILEWALDLEQKGVVGEGMTFSEGEQRRAAAAPVASITIGTIENMAGTIGVNYGSQNTTAMQMSHSDFITNVRKFTTATREMLKDGPSEEVNEVRCALDEVDIEINSPEQEEGRIKKALRKVASAAVSLGTFAAQAAIKAEIGKLLSSK